MDRYKVTDSFSTGRVLNLAKRTVAIQGRGWFTGFAAAIGILTLWWFYPLINNTQPWHHYQAASLIPTALFLFHLGGYLMTSKIFNELHTPSTAFLSLTLPASTTEKLICAWLITDRKSTRLNSSHVAISYAPAFNSLSLHDALPIFC